jgi:hypothetical protein
MSFLVADSEAHLATLPVMASGGDRDERPWGGGPSHDGPQQPSYRAKMDVSPGRALSLVM